MRNQQLNPPSIVIAVSTIALLVIGVTGCGKSETGTAPRGQSTPGGPSGPQGTGPYTHQVLSASSEDGLNWTPDNRVLIDHASVPSEVVTPEGNLRVYYVDATQTPENVNCAESTDGGRTFRALGCTIEGRSGQKAVDPSIVLLPDGRYRLYYFAVEGEMSKPYPHSICSAVSANGIHFSQEKEVFSYPGLVDPDVFWSGDEWMMYVFSLVDAATIVARSRDGLSFEYAGPLAIQGWGTTAPVRLDDGGFRLYAFEQKGAQRVASFVSTDCVSWTQEPGDRMTAPEGGRITDPFVVRMPDGSWKMIFKFEPQGEGKPGPAPPWQGTPQPPGRGQ